MFVFGNLFSTIGSILNMLLSLYLWIIIARVVFSWVRPDPYNPLVRTICKLVDPVTYRISKIIPTRTGMIDFAPFILNAHYHVSERVSCKNPFRYRDKDALNRPAASSR